ncbi:MAG: aminoglycoside 6-adenylyltransferase [Anaerolineae bacterium]|nr:aminoglycoside 6-adenylyltransferase [Anaerolineae bacterium]
MMALAQRIATWAAGQDAIRAIIVVGSQARRDHPADRWADLDLMMFVNDMTLYLGETAWLSNFGTLWLCLPFEQAGEEPQRLAVFEGGQKVDCHFFAVSELVKMVEAGTLEDVYQRGYYALIDKDGLVARLPPPSYVLPAQNPPASDEFALMVTRFWYEALQTAKTIRRRDLWVVKGWDMGLKHTLLWFIAWHARAMNGWNHDTWHAGRFMLDWTDAETKQALDGLFGHFDPVDSWRALFATITLYQHLAREIALRLGYTYDVELEQRIGGLIRELYAEDGSG